MLTGGNVLPGGVLNTRGDGYQSTFNQQAMKRCSKPQQKTEYLRSDSCISAAHRRRNRCRLNETRRRWRCGKWRGKWCGKRRGERCWSRCGSRCWSRCWSRRLWRKRRRRSRCWLRSGTRLRICVVWSGFFFSKITQNTTCGYRWRHINWKFERFRCS